MEHPVTAEDPLALQDGALDAVLARNRGSQWAPSKQGGGPPKAKGQKGGGKGGGGRSAGAKRKAAQGGKPAVKLLKVRARHVSCLSSPMFPPAEKEEFWKQRQGPGSDRQVAAVMLQNVKPEAAA